MPDPDTPPGLAARLAKQPEDHKYGHGHALILCGGPGRGGAARMAARGALRIGAGLVTLGVPPAAQQENAIRLDAIMLRRVADAAALTDLLQDTRLNAICIGPGFGLSDDHADLVAAALAAGRATVLDADALTLLSRDADLFGQLHDGCVLTPHAGEFARLFPDIADRVEDRAEATRAAAARAGCTVLLKGAVTVIADPDGTTATHRAEGAHAAPWLATAGAGDVLAGFIAGLLARGNPPLQAAEDAAWLHAACARAFGPGLIAEDLPDMLPKVFRTLDL